MRVINGLWICALIPWIFTACSEVISARADGQAWKEFLQSEGPTRAPASSESELQKRLSQISMRDLLIACDQVSTREACYREAIARRFDEAYQASAGTSANSTRQEYRKEQALFLASAEYSQILKKVDRFHLELLSGIENTARARVRKLVSECERVPEERRIEQFDLIWGITTEIPKSVYACLVAEWTEAADRVIAEAATRLGVRMETPGANAWIRSRQVYPIFESELATILKGKAAREAQELERLKPSLRNEIHPFQTDEQALSRFAPGLRKKFPYTHVEQWILEVKNSQK